MTRDGVPYIGPFSSSTPNLYVATGFEKWGMTSSMVAAGLLTDLISGRKHPFADVFSPLRFAPPVLRKTCDEAGQATKGLTRGFLPRGAPR